MYLGEARRGEKRQKGRNDELWRPKEVSDDDAQILLLLLLPFASTLASRVVMAQSLFFWGGVTVFHVTSRPSQPASL
ncbi:hypothetical protein K504DRAFT_458341 [Pleomassaria siparia CBS 279.74]|uniref:Uncharacterized protein n=1 Tax=Pleomassaria siparia CBS 279.74 TaxID=1314801 RepID=A0A6G1K4P5_9PLEO|nr:hypothetical protein K504DRAFT_458341 [Pleomassaria siparia CBS 279.74]